MSASLDGTTSQATEVGKTASEDENAIQGSLSSSATAPIVRKPNALSTPFIRNFAKRSSQAIGMDNEDGSPSIVEIGSPG